MYLTLKALHIIGVVTWFAGLFYIVRLFVYLRETQDRPQAERDVLQPQLRLMARRLWYGITWPSAVATLVLGTGLLHLFWPPPGWLQVKLALVALLFGYHLVCDRLHRRLQAGEAVASSTFFRVWNEVATLFLVGIVFLVVLKDAISLVWAILGLLLFTGALMVGIVTYRRIRERRSPTGG